MIIKILNINTMIQIWYSIMIMICHLCYLKYLLCNSYKLLVKTSYKFLLETLLFSSFELLFSLHFFNKWFTFMSCLIQYFCRFIYDNKFHHVIIIYISCIITWYISHYLNKIFKEFNKKQIFSNVAFKNNCKYMM